MAEEKNLNFADQLPVVGADKGVIQHLGYGLRVLADDVAHGGDLHVCSAVVDGLGVDAHHMAAADES